MVVRCGAVWCAIAIAIAIAESLRTTGGSREAPDLAWDEAGLQLPAGTIKPGELPEQAVEANEETGLQGLRVVQHLGVGECDRRPYADAIHARHYFQLTTDSSDLLERRKLTRTVTESVIASASSSPPENDCRNRVEVHDLGACIALY